MNFKNLDYSNPKKRVKVRNVAWTVRVLNVETVTANSAECKSAYSGDCKSAYAGSLSASEQSPLCKSVT